MRTFHEYRLRFYLNGQHYVVFNGRKGAVHPHTWEISLTVRFPRSQTHQFSDYESRILDFLDTYQNKTLNDLEPFNRINPTLENLSEFLCDEFAKILRRCGGQLRKLEVSESPSRTYILDPELEDAGLMDANSSAYFESLANSVLDILDL